MAKITGDYIAEYDVRLGVERVSKAIQQREKLKPQQDSLYAEKIVCIESRSLFVAFKDSVLWSGFDERVITCVRNSLSDALKCLRTDKNCIRSVKFRLLEFENLVARLPRPKPAPPPSTLARFRFPRRQFGLKHA